MIQKQPIFYRIKEMIDQLKAMKEGNPSVDEVNEIDRDIARLKAIRSETRSAHSEQLEDIERRLLPIEQKYLHGNE